MKRKPNRKKEHAVKIISDEKLKNPAEIKQESGFAEFSKEILEKKRFAGYYKTKVRFVN